MPVIWYSPIVSLTERIGSIVTPAATASRYAGLAVLNPSSEEPAPGFAIATAEIAATLASAASSTAIRRFLIPPPSETRSEM